MDTKTITVELDPMDAATITSLCRIGVVQDEDPLLCLGAKKLMETLRGAVLKVIDPEQAIEAIDEALAEMREDAEAPEGAIKALEQLREEAESANAISEDEIDPEALGAELDKFLAEQGGDDR